MPFECASFAPRTFRNPNVAEFCDRTIDRRIDLALAARDPYANALWNDVYRRVADAAPLVPLVNRQRLTPVSTRVGNYQPHALWSTLLDQLWVH